MNLNWIQIGSVVMFLGVALGAFGSHALKGKLSVYAIEIYKTGILYHFIHGFALFLISWIITVSTDPKIHYAGLCFLLGIIFFSGSLYILAITGIKTFGIITPIGGVLFLCGWGLLFFSQISR